MFGLAWVSSEGGGREHIERTRELVCVHSGEWWHWEERRYYYCREAGRQTLHSSLLISSPWLRLELLHLFPSSPISLHSRDGRHGDHSWATSLKGKWEHLGGRLEVAALILVCGNMLWLVLEVFCKASPNTSVWSHVLPVLIQPSLRLDRFIFFFPSYLQTSAHICHAFSLRYSESQTNTETEAFRHSSSRTDSWCRSVQVCSLAVRSELSSPVLSVLFYCCLQISAQSQSKDICSKYYMMQSKGPAVCFVCVCETLSVSLFVRPCFHRVHNRTFAVELSRVLLVVGSNYQEDICLTSWLALLPQQLPFDIKLKTMFFKVEVLVLPFQSLTRDLMNGITSFVGTLYYW